jgi:23S rRNA (guanosine2251-2'-O)-methyltransferase
MPVLEALGDARVEIEHVLLASNARGAHADEILRAARTRGIEVKRLPPDRITRISRNGRHDQGVVADIRSPGLVDLADWNPPDAASVHLLLLDGLTNPGNVGLVIRTATAAGLDGIVVPRAGVADLGPLVIKASAGVAFTAPIMRSATALEAVDSLRLHGFHVYGLSGSAPRSLYESRPFDDRAVFVLGNETEGVSVPVDESLSIPMAAGIDSLNVAVAAGVLCFELVRRRDHPTA